MDQMLIKTRDTREAAAFGTLGVPVTIESILDAKTNDSSVYFNMGAVSADNKVNVSHVRGQLKDGSLPAHHPIYNCLRALKNKKVLQQVIKSGGGVNVKANASGTGFILDASLSCSGMPTVGKVLKTGDLDVVAALAERGSEIYAMLPGTRGLEFYMRGVDEASQMLGGGDYLALVRDLKSGVLAEKDPEHPFLTGVLANVNYRSLVIAVDRSESLVMIQKPGSSKSAFVREGASDQAFDRMSQFFGGRGRFSR